MFLIIVFIAWIVRILRWNCLLINVDGFQTEYERKVEAACNVAFKNEERDVQTMQDINNLLIENILPSSVAAKFLNPDRHTDVSFEGKSFNTSL